MSYSPWGPVNFTKKIRRGVRWVTTDEEGGLMVNWKVALKTLPEPVRKLGESFGGCVCFKEDWHWVIPAVALRDDNLTHAPSPTPSLVRAAAEVAVEHDCVDAYLAACAVAGVTDAQKILDAVA